MRRIAATLAVVVALMFSVRSAWADFDDGRAAYIAGDYAAALRERRPLAERGNAEAQYNLGQMYRHYYVNYEFGLLQDYAEAMNKAMKWYRLATAQGHVCAQTNLGSMYKCRISGGPQSQASRFLYALRRRASWRRIGGGPPW